MLFYYGYNGSKREIDSLIITNYNESDLNNVYLTIDLITYFHNNQLYLLDQYEKNEYLFKNVTIKIQQSSPSIANSHSDDNNNNENITIQSIATNTDCLWLFGNTTSVYNGTKQLLIKYKDLNGKLSKSIEINDSKISDHSMTIQSKLNIFSTDINLYIFDYSQSTCVYQLYNENIIEKLINETKTFSLPLNKRLIDQTIKDICCGKEHMLILADNGLVYSFGIGSRGQLGHNSIESCSEPRPIERFVNVKQIACGGWHSGLIDENGYVWMWGWNINGQIGYRKTPSIEEHDEDSEDEEENTIISKPVLLEIREKKNNNELIKFKKISLGSRHSALIDVNNNLYTFGWNKYKQLCLLHANNENVKVPTHVKQYSNVVDVKCGAWSTLLLVI